MRNIKEIEEKIKYSKCLGKFAVNKDKIFDYDKMEIMYNLCEMLLKERNYCITFKDIYRLYFQLFKNREIQFDFNCNKPKLELSISINRRDYYWKFMNWLDCANFIINNFDMFLNILKQLYKTTKKLPERDWCNIQDTDKDFRKLCKNIAKDFNGHVTFVKSGTCFHV